MSYSEQLRKVWKQYREEVSTDPVDLRTVAAWAIEQKLWTPRPIDLSASLANDLAQALREEKRIDKEGREYRANIPVRSRAKNGVSLFEWADIDDAPRPHVEKNVQQERRSIASDCYALLMKVEHYNAHHPEEEPIQLILAFDDDIAEMKMAKGLDDDEEDAA
jgi:hypothetical protein